MLGEEQRKLSWSLSLSIDYIACKRLSKVSGFIPGSTWRCQGLNWDQVWISMHQWSDLIEDSFPMFNHSHSFSLTGAAHPMEWSHSNSLPAHLRGKVVARSGPCEQTSGSVKLTLVVNPYSPKLATTSPVPFQVCGNDGGPGGYGCSSVPNLLRRIIIRIKWGFGNHICNSVLLGQGIG